MYDIICPRFGEHFTSEAHSLYNFISHPRLFEGEMPFKYLSRGLLRGSPLIRAVEAIELPRYFSLLSSVSIALRLHVALPVGDKMFRCASSRMIPTMLFPDR